MRPPFCALRTPGVVTGQAWAAIGLMRGVFPHLKFNTFYYTADLPLPNPALTARQFNIDWWSMHGGFCAAHTQVLHAMNTGPTFIYDGTVIHSYPIFLGTLGTNVLDFIDDGHGVSITKYADPALHTGNPRGVSVWSPIEELYCPLGNTLSGFGMLVYRNMARNLFLFPMTSEGNTWQPALLYDSDTKLAPIYSIHLSKRVAVYRRRYRNGTYEAHLFNPPPFPTPVG